MSDRKIVLITGGNRGIGFGTMEAICQKSSKHQIIIASRKKSDAEVAVSGAQKLGYRNPLSALVLDITDDDSIAAAVGEVEKQFGRLDVLINNAAVGLLEDSSSTATWRATWNQTFNTNVASVRLTTYAFLPLLRKSASPRVINISSVRGSFARSLANTNPPTASLPYSVSKAAVNLLTLEMAKEPGMSVYAVSPGHCKTGFNGFRGERDPVEGGRCAAELVDAQDGMFGSGFWEFEEGTMREVGW